MRRTEWQSKWPLQLRSLQRRTKIGWTLAAIPRNFASVIGDLMWTAPRPRAFRNLLEKPGRLSLGMSGSNCIDIGIQVQVSSSKCSGMDMKQPTLPKPSWRLHGGFLKALGCLLRALGRLLGGSWEALDGFQEASWIKDRNSYNFLTIFEKNRKF